ncbi:MAG: DinB family protein [Planctomycetales bacterium]
MNAIDLIQRIHQHRAWANERLLAAAGTITADQLSREFPIGQGSIWKSLLHLYAAEFVWLGALLGDDNPVVPGDLPGRIPGNQQGTGGIASFADLREKWAELEQRWRHYLADLPSDALDEPVYKFAFASGQRFATRRADVLLHVCTHAQYTTAQVINMLRQSGVAPLPETMLISLARSEVSR